MNKSIKLHPFDQIEILCLIFKKMKQAVSFFFFDIEYMYNYIVMAFVTTDLFTTSSYWLSILNPEDFEYSKIFNSEKKLSDSILITTNIEIWLSLVFKPKKMRVTLPVWEHFYQKKNRQKTTLFWSYIERVAVSFMNEHLLTLLLFVA